MTFENIYMEKQNGSERNPNPDTTNHNGSDGENAGASKQLVSEIFTKVNNAKDKPKKIEVLRQYDSPGLRMILKGGFDPNIKWELPEGDPPYIANEALVQNILIWKLNQRDYITLLKGGNDQLNKIRKETLFIQMLEGLT